MQSSNYYLDFNAQIFIGRDVEHLIWNCGSSRKSGAWMNEWIDSDLKCNGVKDCMDGKDEQPYICSPEGNTGAIHKLKFDAFVIFMVY